ncbi:hypothetical protein LIER_35371 [Lithospermum erythrorhizon]|uniref:Transmembrane protein n=1 Tax=Lithospermum erythrorhizon TaxID=34254 RepID=A0AAV3NPN3_LITER
MSEPPKLLVNKPKKSQLKKVEQPCSTPSSASTATAWRLLQFRRRYKFLWPVLLAVNFSVGAYLFMRTKKKDVEIDEEKKDVSTSSIACQPREPILEDQQRELFKWLLEEKRKMKPIDAFEKKCIDEEKAILKQFIRSQSIPTLR